MGREEGAWLLTTDAARSSLAEKRYLPRSVSAKGMLEAMGVQRASTFRNDVAYREGRQFRKTRDRRAIERMSTYGKKLLQDRWTGTEHDVMSRLWSAGVSVPYPIGFADDVFDLEYVGSWEMAAPQLAARPALVCETGARARTHTHPLPS